MNTHTIIDDTGIVYTTQNDITDLIRSKAFQQDEKRLKQERKDHPDRFVNVLQEKTDQCFCQSYYDDNNVLLDCTCGKCGKTPNTALQEEWKQRFFDKFVIVDHGFDGDDYDAKPMEWNGWNTINPDEYQIEQMMDFITQELTLSQEQKEKA